MVYLLSLMRQTHNEKIGESSSGRMTVSKTVHGGSNPSSPVLEGRYHVVSSFFAMIWGIGNMKKVKRNGNILLFAGMVLLIIFIFMDSENPVIGIIGMIISVMGFVYYGIFWRCPHCSRHLPMQGTLGMEHCPYCGNKLDD